MKIEVLTSPLCGAGELGERTQTELNLFFAQKCVLICFVDTHG